MNPWQTAALALLILVFLICVAGAAVTVWRRWHAHHSLWIPRHKLDVSYRTNQFRH